MAFIGPKEIRIEWIRPYRGQATTRNYSPREENVINEWIDTALKKDFIEPSVSTTTSPILVVPKKNSDKIRMTINYKQLNSCVQPVVHAPGGRQSMRNRIAKHRYFSKIDLEDAFYNLSVRPADRPLLAFRTPRGLFQPKALPQGLGVAPALFQIFIERLLWKYNGHWLTVYLDDILLHMSQRHDIQMIERTIREQLRKHGVRINEAKSTGIVTRVEYCGDIYEAHTHRPARRTSDIIDWPIPRNLTSLRRFLGMCNEFMGYSRNYAQIAGPLYEMTRSSDETLQRFWTQRHTAAFHSLKQAVQRHVSMNYHDPSGPATIISDASDYAIGAYMQQYGRTTVIWSRKLNNAERNYDTTDRELLAVAEFTEKYDYLLDSACRIRVFTDHMNLIKGLTEKPTNRRRNRDMEQVARLCITWQHIEGTRNWADVLSRKPLR